MGGWGLVGRSVGGWVGGWMDGRVSGRAGGRVGGWALHKSDDKHITLSDIGVRP